MPSTLADAILVIEEADGVRYRFPVLIATRGCAVFILLFCLTLLCGGIGLWLSVLLEDVGVLPLWAEVSLAVVGTAVLLAVFWWPMRFLWRGVSLGWFPGFGYPEVRLGRGVLSGGFYQGRLRKDQSATVATIRRLVVRPWATIELSDLVAEMVDGKLVVLLTGRPQKWLSAVAEDVSGRCGLPTGFEPIDQPVPQKLVVAEGPVPDPFDGSPGPPAGCRIEVEGHPDGVTVNVPAPGAWRAAPWLLGLGLLYAILIGCAEVYLLYAYLIGEFQLSDEEDRLILLAFGIGHWVVAAGIILPALSLGRRRACLAIVGDKFIFIHRGLFSSNREEWSREQIADIRNDVAVLGLQGPAYQCLQIRLLDGNIRALLEGRDPAELRWIATVLRQALGMRVNLPDASA
jgi:hypothetical protein